MAFETLSGDRKKGKGKKKAALQGEGLPLEGERPVLRHHISMGNETRDGMGKAV